MINDISTNLEDPPVFEYIPMKKAQKMDYCKNRAFEQRKKHPEIKTLVLAKQENLNLFNKVLKCAKACPNWKLHSVNPDNLKIEATATTPILRFKDDLVIEIRERNKKEWAIEMRSKSRLGRNDFGANAKRITMFFEKLRKHV